MEEKVEDASRFFLYLCQQTPNRRLETPMIIKTEDELCQMVKKILLTAGADERNATGVAQHLARANLSGVDTHGIWQLRGYVEAIQAGELLPTAWPGIVSEAANHVLITGNWTFGQIAARYAMEMAIEKTREHGMAVAGVVQMNHIGRLGHYVEMAVEAGMIAVVMDGGLSETLAVTVPYKGSKAVLNTNPIAMGFPAGEEWPMMFDFATTTLSGSKVANYRERGEQVPPDSVVDKEGNPSVDPEVFFSGGGSFAPFGLHKGYCLMMGVEYFGRMLTGSDTYAEEGRGGDIMGHHGVSMIVIKADLFRPFADFTESAGEMQQRVRAVPPAPGYDEVLAPGDMEARSRAERRRNGIPVAEHIWQNITELAASLGLEEI
jgi:LDH2 family malate/lactate/ureidoglycolate dehydrogenase